MITTKLAGPHTQTGTQVCIENVSKVIVSKSTQTMILDSISFSIPMGSLFAINGPSGSGKSTLLNILTGIDRPTTGRILFADQELRNMSENRLAKWRGRHICIVFPFFQLLPTPTPPGKAMVPPGFVGPGSPQPGRGTAID